MFGKAKKEVDREVNFVKALRSNSVNLAGVTDEFLKYNDKISEKLCNSVAKSTGDRYYVEFQKFSKFCVENNVPALPSDPEVINTYFCKLAEESNSVNTVNNARSAIRHYNLIYRPDLESPTDRVDVVMVNSSLKREFGKPVNKRPGVSKEIVDSLITKTLKGEQLKDKGFTVFIKDWCIVALTTVMFFAFARYEECAALKKSHFKVLENGDLEITFLKAKNNQFHDAKTTVIAAKGGLLCPVNVIMKFFKVVNSDLDHYFLPKFSGNSVFLLEESCYIVCLSHFRKLLKNCGVQNANEFGLHSAKIGGVSEAGNAGCSTEQIQLHGRWNSSQMPLIYQKRSVSRKRKVAEMLNNL